jgi:hypothetical protein
MLVWAELQQMRQANATLLFSIRSHILRQAGGGPTMKFAIWSSTLVFALSIASAAIAENKPFTCAYDQFTASERTAIGKQIVAAQESGDDRAMADLEKKDTQLIGQKLVQCPTFKAFNEQQKTIAFGYAMTALVKDGLNATYPTDDGKPVLDAFWDGMPEDLRKTLVKAATAPHAAAGQDALNKFSSSPYISQFISAHKLEERTRTTLIASVTANMFLISLEDHWISGKPLN